MKPHDNGAYHGGSGWQALINDPTAYEDVVCADVNDAFYSPAPRVVETVRTWAHRANFGADARSVRLRERLASITHVPIHQIHVGCGSSELLQLLIFCLVGSNDGVVTLDPTYSEYGRCISSRGAIIHRIELDEGAQFSCDMKRLACRASDSRMVVLCNPNNPTGQVISRREMLELLKILGSEVTVLVDEAYIDYAITESLVSDVTTYPNLVVLRTFSKAYALSGLRVGYATLGEGVNEKFGSVVRPPWPVGLLAARAAEVALDEYEYVKQKITETLDLKRQLVEGLAGFERLQLFESCTGYFMAKLRRNGVNSAELTQELEGEGVFLRDCAPFGSSLGSSFLRINTQSASHNERIICAIRAVLDRH